MQAILSVIALYLMILVGVYWNSSRTRAQRSHLSSGNIVDYNPSNETASTIVADGIMTELVSQVIPAVAESEFDDALIHTEAAFDGVHGAGAGAGSGADIGSTESPFVVEYDSDGYFLWVAWPRQNDHSPGLWPVFYSQVLSFIDSNPAGVRVNRVILEVVEPTRNASNGQLLWQVNWESVLYTNFLAALPVSVDVKIYTNLSDWYQATNWKESTNANNALYAVFKYVDQWNALLAELRPEVRISGIVANWRNYILEEYGEFSLDFVRHGIPNYKAAGGESGGAPPLTFGTTIGRLDCIDRVISNETFEHIDEFYIRMSNFYVEGSSPLITVATSDPEYLNQGEKLLSTLTSLKIIKPKLFANNKFHFMWSIQEGEFNGYSLTCRYPQHVMHPVHHSMYERCGATNEFGDWQPSKFHEFVNLLKSRHPEFAFPKAHGINDFGLLPSWWLPEEVREDPRGRPVYFPPPIVYQPSRFEENLAAVRTNPDGYFLWVNWPRQVSNDPTMWPVFFAQLLSFINGNAAGVQVNKVILRVVDPATRAGDLLLWQVDAHSVLYEHFLRHIPLHVDVKIHPCVDESSSDSWRNHMGTRTALEAVFKYTSQWRDLLDAIRPGVRVSGIVTDWEEISLHQGGDFGQHFNLIPEFKAIYGSDLTFGTALAYDTTEWINRKHFQDVDEFYMRMYRWFIKRSAPVIKLAVGDAEYVDEPGKVLHTLKSWGMLEPSAFASSKFHFMWSVQRADKQMEGIMCLYPLSGRDTVTKLPYQQCGSSNQFGTWDPAKFHGFINLLKAQHAEFANPKSHGLYEFAFMPNSWI